MVKLKFKIIEKDSKQLFKALKEATNGQSLTQEKTQILLAL